HPPSPTDPNVNRATAHRAIQPAPTNPAAPKYPHSSSILNASRFCTATAQSTPRPTDPPASSYFQTTIKIGNNFMQLLTNSAVEIPLGDDRARAWSAASSLSEFSLSMRAPSPLMPASHRIVRCCAAVVNAQRRRLHENQVDEQHDKIMLDILVREPFAPRTLRQPYIAADHGRCSLPFAFTSRRSRVDRLLRRVRLSRLGRAVDGRRPARARIAAMENMVESGNWVATFYANGHTTLPEAWYVGNAPG
ncbi:MAG: hypothetical protein Q9197_003583, partial [Variospora fuerteventurae]